MAKEEQVKEVTREDVAQPEELKITFENFEKFQNAYLHSLASLIKQEMDSNTQDGKKWLWNKLKEEFNKVMKE